MKKLLYIVYIALIALGINHIVALFFHGSMLYYSYIVVLVLASSAVAIVFVCIKCALRWNNKPFFTECRGLLVACMLLNIFMMVCMMHDYAIDASNYTYGMAMEMARSGELYTTHPYMGGELETVIPLRIQVLCLPAVYAAITSIMGIDVLPLLQHIVPIVTWLVTLLVGGLFARMLYPQDDRKMLRFMIVYCMAFFLTRHVPNLFGYQLFYEGYTGESIRALVLIPSMIYAVLTRKPVLVCMILATEVFLVWTTYGIGYCFLVMVLSFIVSCRKVSKGVR